MTYAEHLNRGRTAFAAVCFIRYECKSALVQIQAIDTQNGPYFLMGRTKLENGGPLLLAQLSETFHAESIGTPHTDGAIGSTATRHGGVSSGVA